MPSGEWVTANEFRGYLMEINGCVCGKMPPKSLWKDGLTWYTAYNVCCGGCNDA